MVGKSILAIGIVILIGVGAWLALTTSAVKTTTDDIQPATTVSTDITPSSDKKAAATSSPGRYTNYDAKLVQADGFDTTILFFHAPWCPECRAYEQAITSSAIPDGVQILKVDYDTSKDLRSRYGVTIQTTFVRVDSNGGEQKKWVGYGKDKSLAAVLENVS